MNNESCPVDGWHVTVQFSPSQSLSAEAFFSSTWFPSSLPSLAPRIHKAYSEMLYFEEHVQRETFKPIRHNQRCNYLFLFSPDLRVGNLLHQSLNWGCLCHPHPHFSQQLSPCAQQGSTAAPATPWTLPWCHRARTVRNGL